MFHSIISVSRRMIVNKSLKMARLQICNYFALVIVALSFQACFSESILHRQAVADNGNVLIDWFVNFDQSSVHFILAVKTKSYIGFGISSTGGMSGADLIIGGVHENGTSYFSDRYATSIGTPIVDTVQNWELVEAYETDTHTIIRISRLLDTGDVAGDVIIKDENTHFIWAYGTDNGTDVITYHDSNRGSIQLNPLSIVDPQPNTQRRREVLDDNGDYVVSWLIDYDIESVEFQVEVKTTGWFGFGLSPAGGMTSADIVIGGVHANGSVYFEDRHATGTSMPIVDTVQNWVPLYATENDTHTVFIFSRDFETCDVQDLSLTNDTLNFIWSYGPTDVPQYHGSTNRGTFQVLPLDPELPPVDTEKFQKYEITHTMTMPSVDTTYWCTIQKSPRFTSKHHIVAFEPKIETPAARAHTHHYAIFRCTPPDNQTAEEYFEPYVGQPGGDCKVPNPGVPAPYCQTMFYTWAVGGKKLIFPDNIGCPIGEDDSPVDYYMFEVHYNNPQQLIGVRFETGATIYYTDELRDHDAGILMVAHQTSLALMVPPSSTGYKTVGHCDPYCTSNYLPQTGINIFALLHHAHLSARKMKLRHFRGNQELPWVKNDENYDFEYQQTRPMRSELVVLPGDHLTTECVYDTTWRNGTTIGGLATRDEMCQSTFWYYPRSLLRECRSEYQMTQLLPKFGIEQLANRSYPYEDVMVTAPPTLAGLRYTDVLDRRVNWTQALRDEVQRDSNFGLHDGVCYIIGGSDDVPHPTTYPSYDEQFEPHDPCQ